MKWLRESNRPRHILYGFLGALIGTLLFAVGLAIGKEYGDKGMGREIRPARFMGNTDRRYCRTNCSIIYYMEDMDIILDFISSDQIGELKRRAVIILVFWIIMVIAVFIDLWTGVEKARADTSKFIAINLGER